MAVCRNWRGEILKVRFKRIYGAESIKGEARAARLACLLAEDFDYCDVIMEGDAQILVNQVVDLDTVPDWVIEAEVLTIRALLRNHSKWKFRWIPRNGNCLAHNLARWGLQSDFPADTKLEDIPVTIIANS